MIGADGVSPNISGINDTGNWTAAASDSTSDVVRLVSAIIQLRALERNPTGVIIHPTNYESILLNQAAGSGTFDLPAM